MLALSRDVCLESLTPRQCLCIKWLSGQGHLSESAITSLPQLTATVFSIFCHHRCRIEYHISHISHQLLEIRENIVLHHVCVGNEIVFLFVK